MAWFWKQYREESRQAGVYLLCGVWLCLGFWGVLKQERGVTYLGRRMSIRRQLTPHISKHISDANIHGTSVVVSSYHVSLSFLDTP